MTLALVPPLPPPDPSEEVRSAAVRLLVFKLYYYSALSDRFCYVVPLNLSPDPSEEVRSAAVRLLVSKLYPRPHLRPAIVATAALRLSALALPLHPQPPNPHPNTHPPDQQQGQQQPQQPDDQQAGPSAGAGEAAPGQVAVKQEQQEGEQGQGQQGGPSNPAAAAAAAAPEPSVSDCTRGVALYVGLVPRQPDMLPALLSSYAAGGPNLQVGAWGCDGGGGVEGMRAERADWRRWGGAWGGGGSSAVVGKGRHLLRRGTAHVVRPQAAMGGGPPTVFLPHSG